MVTCNLLVGPCFRQCRLRTVADERQSTLYPWQPDQQQRRHWCHDGEQNGQFVFQQGSQGPFKPFTTGRGSVRGSQVTVVHAVLFLATRSHIT